MNQIIKSLLIHPYSSFFFIGFGSFLIVLSYFFPYAQFPDQSYSYPLIIVQDVLGKFYQSNALLSFIVMILLYPYLFTIILIVLLPKVIHQKINLWLEGLSTKIKKNKGISILASIFKYMILVLSNLLPIIVNCYVYFGFFVSPNRGISYTVIGLFLLIINIVYFYYFFRNWVIQNNYCSRFLYIGLFYGVSSIIFFVMIMLVFNGHQASLLVGSYCSVIGSIFTLSGLSFYLYQSKRNESLKFVSLGDEKALPKKTNKKK